ncbi:unnamed protein product [Paramecium pentaurelia]|uniref:DUF2804 domain-containing protein n=1 Tax=Paramecium pentaurelia TaxID=43138 RepID=A0A8S1RXB5_9CILI|nr:unnamed protein product [Paramecium pentaurelia]
MKSQIFILFGIFVAFVVYLRTLEINEQVQRLKFAPEVNTPGDVLKDGNLVVNGFARRDIRKFDSSQISLLNRLFRFKQWDYFHLVTSDIYLAIAFVDLGYVQSIQFTFYSVKNNYFIHKDKVVYPFQTRQFTLEDECTLKGNLTRTFKSDSIYVEYKGWLHNGIEMRSIQIIFDGFDASFIMESHQKDDLFILKPFTEKGDKFFYSRKAYGWHAYGSIKYDKQSHKFTKANAGMDYGRGIFNYATFWLWVSGMGFSQDHRIGFNLGAAGDNVKGKETSDEGIFIDNELFILSDLEYSFDLNDLNKKIIVKGKDFYLEFIPKTTHLFTEDLLLIDVKFRQLIGVFNGKFKDIEFSDIVGLVELNRAKW